MTDELKLVIRGLPFEATKGEVASFLGIADEQLDLLIWSDSGRCRGVGFIICNDSDQKDQIKREFDGQEFTADGNCRKISIQQFEHRGRKKKEKPQRSQPVEQTYQSDSETSREVFISNASFDAKEQDFRDHFGVCGEIESITIPTQFTTGRPKGFAFVCFVNKASVKQALEQLDGSTMCDRKIGVRQNRGRADRPERQPRERSTGLSEKPDGCTTVYVGNLPWSTEEEHLENLFAEFGPITSTRIVRQSFTQRSRGFGYVEFENEESTDKAVQKVLFVDGRELRLDYAQSLKSN